MKAGLLRDRITFEARLVTRPNNQMTIRWSEEIVDGAILDEPADVQRITQTDCRFIVRYRPGIAPDTHRIIYDNEIWEITSVIRDNKLSMLTIEADFSEAVEVTHLQSDKREYKAATPVTRTRKT